MKKTGLLLFISLAVLANAGIAQENSRSTFHFGPKAGLNLSGVYDTDNEDFEADAKIGLAAGLFLSIPLGPFLGVQPEILFSQKGFKASTVILGDENTYTRTLNYVDFPLLVTVKPSKLLSIVAGPQYSFLFSSKDVFDNSLLTVEQEQEFNHDDLRKNTLCFLGGFDFNLNKVVIGTRVGWDLFQNHSDGSTTNSRYKNVWLQATLGLRF